MQTLKPFGYRLLGLASVALGAVGLFWDDFALVWQPVPSTLPGRWLLAYLTGGLLLAAGLATQWRRTRTYGLIGLTILYGLGVVLLHLPEVIAQPRALYVWSGAAEQLAIVAGGLLALCVVAADGDPKAPKLRDAGRIIFGLCLLVFGAAHFVYLPQTAAFAPQWLPPGPTFWAIATGFGHVAAGLAILSGVLDRLAAWLATAMFAVFSLLVHIPVLIATPTTHMAWTENAINLVLVAAAWSMADALSARRRPGL